MSSVQEILHSLRPPNSSSGLGTGGPHRSRSPPRTVGASTSPPSGNGLASDAGASNASAARSRTPARSPARGSPQPRTTSPHQQQQHQQRGHASHHRHNNHNSEGLTIEQQTERASLERLSSEGSQGGFQELPAFLSLPFFSDFDTRSAKKLSAAFDRRTLAFGETVVSQGGENAGFHVLVRGGVDMIITTADGEERLLERKTNPAWFGASALVADGLVPLTVRANEEGTIVLSIGAAEFEQFIHDNPNTRVALEYKHGMPVPKPHHHHHHAHSHHHTSSSPPKFGSGLAASASAGTLLNPSHSSAAAHSISYANAPVMQSSSSSSTSSSSSSSKDPSHSALTADLDKLKLFVRLREIPFFQQLGRSIPEIKLQQLATLFEFRRASPGECLMREHDVADGFYILLDGRVNVSAMSPNHQAMHLATLSAGSIMGEIAELYNTRRTATLTTVQACTFLYLSSSNFTIFLKLAPEVRENGLLTKIMQKRIGNSLKTIPLFSFLRLKEIGPLKTFREDILEQLGKLFIFSFLPANTTIFHEGDIADAFYIIHRGTVEVVTKVDDPQSCNGELNEEGQLILTELGQADHFGELCFQTPLPTTPSSAASASSSASSSSSSAPPSFPTTRRTATVRTLTDCVFLKLSSEHFSTFLSVVPEIKTTLDRVMSMRTAQTLANIPFFRTIRENKPWSKLSILGGMFRFRHTRAGDIVVTEGEVGDTFYVVVDGSVEVTKMVYHPRTQTKEQVVLDILHRNSYFGEISLLKETIRLATVRCLEDCLFLTVTRANFSKFCEIAPDIVDSFSSLVTHRTANLLSSIPFFHENIVENKPWSKLELLCTLFEYEFFEMGTIVMKEGDEEEESHKLYVLSVGSVMATRKRREDDPSVSDTFPTISPDAAAVLPSIPMPRVSPTNRANNLRARNGGGANGGGGGARVAQAADPELITVSRPQFVAPSQSSPSSSSSSASAAAAAASSDTLEAPQTGRSPVNAASILLNVDSRRSTAGPGASSSSSSSAAASSSSSTISPPPPLGRDDSSLYQKILVRGSFFNEKCLIYSMEPRPLTITTLEPCVFFTLTKPKFEKFCQVCPELLESLRDMYPSSAGPLSAKEKATERARQQSTSKNSAAHSLNPSPTHQQQQQHHFDEAGFAFNFGDPIPAELLQAAAPFAVGGGSSVAAAASAAPPASLPRSSLSSVSRTRASHHNTMPLPTPSDPLASIPLPGTTTGDMPPHATAAVASSSSSYPLPLRHSTSFSSSLRGPLGVGDLSDASLDGSSMDLGHSVLVDCMTVHAFDGTIKTSRKNTEVRNSPKSEKGTLDFTVSEEEEAKATPAAVSSSSSVAASASSSPKAAAGV